MTETEKAISPISVQMGENKIEITREFQILRDNLILETQGITSIETPEAAESVVLMVRNMKKFSKDLEASRTSVKAPVLALGKTIDALAKNLGDPLEAEVRRAEGVLSSYQQEQARKKREAEMEIIRKQEAAAAEQRRLDALAKLSESLEEKREIAREKSEIAIQASQSIQPVQVETKIQGAAISEEPKYEISDILAFFQKYPDLCEISPKAGDIKKAIRSGRIPKGSADGIRAWTEATARVR